MSDYEPAGAPTKKQVRELLNPLATLRGEIVGAYAQVEYLLGDLYVQARHRPEYRGIGARFPYQVESRISSARIIFSVEGPLLKYAEQADGLLDRILSFEGLRNYMAHGYLDIQVNKSGQHRIRFQMYVPKKGGKLDRHVHRTDIPTLAAEAEQIGSYASEFVRLWRKMYMVEKFEMV
jgi:hypothetical protein